MVEIIGDSDADLNTIRDCLGAYVSAHPQAEISLFRSGSVTIRVRVIDPDFRKINRFERDGELWDLLETLPEDVFGQVAILLTLTPEEQSGPFAHMAFDAPVL